MADYDGDPGRKRFYISLSRELAEEFGEISHEAELTFSGCSEFGRFEFHNLGQDGGTKGLQAWSLTD